LIREDLSLSQGLFRSTQATSRITHAISVALTFAEITHDVIYIRRFEAR